MAKFIIQNDGLMNSFTFTPECNMPLSYLVYGSAGMLVITLLLYLFSRKKRK